MADEILPSLGNIRLRWYPDGAFANEYWPTVAELNAGQELEQVVAWDDFEPLVQSSDDVTRTHLASKAVETRRGAANYGGTIGFDYPGYKADLANAAALVYAALKDLNIPGYLAWSVDGEIGESGQPASDLTFANGDLVNIIKVTTDAWEDSITGEEDFFYSRTFLRRGMLAIYTVASTAAPVLAVTVDNLSPAVGTLSFVTATVNGREWTRGALLQSADPNVFTVSKNGVITPIGIGDAPLIVTLPNSAVTDNSIEIEVPS